MIPFALLSAAFAGSVYINGVRADLLPEVTLTNATVRLDAQGNVWIDAPGYRVQVVQPGEAVPTNTPAPAPARPAPVAAPAATVGQGDAAPVATGTWWLVTEDDGSSGHSLEVLINGTLVRRVASGEPQLILDIGPYLRRGPNDVVVQATVAGATGGGPLTVYVGRGNNLSGTLRLDNPDIAYSRRASDGAKGGGARQYTLTVP